ncbi:RCC1 and BTB domain containing protein claret [Aphomia sociella]
MSQQSESLDFSGLFKLDVLIHLDITAYSFYEVGLKKFLAFSSVKQLLFIYIDPQGDKHYMYYDWDFLDNPIYCMCFEPSGTWVLIISHQKVLLVPFLPLFIPQNEFDHKWSLSSVTVLPLSNVLKPTSVVWWLTKESDNIIIFASKTGGIIFYSLESQDIVGECKVSGEITDLQISFDDSLDLLALLISSGKSQQWKLVLEHRSFAYNWLQQTKAQTDKDKRDSFMSFMKQLSKDKITFLIQGGSKDDNKSQTVEHALKPTEYLPLYRKGSNNWALTAQYVNGRHFLSAFELNEGTLILESPEEDTPSRTLRPHTKKDGQYIQGLWSQRVIYLLRNNEVEIHSASFSVIQGDALLGAKRDFTELWRAELIGDVRRAHLMSAKEPAATVTGWREPTFIRDLQLPRFNIEPCLIVTNRGAYILNTISEPCEWLVGLIMRGGVGAEQSAAALGAPVPSLLRAAADMLLSRGNIAPAHYLYSLSQSQPDGWVARLGVFGRLHELSMYKHVSTTGSLGDGAITIKLLAILLKIGTNHEEKFEMDTKLTTLNNVELLELSSIAAAIGLWELVPKFSVHRGCPRLMLAAIKSRRDMCRGALNCLLQQSSVVPLLLEENAQWLFDFIVEKCYNLDTALLKDLCLWLNPLQDQLRPIIRDMNQGITSIYTTRMLYLISTFMYVVCAIESRHPCPDINLEVTQTAETWKSYFAPKRVLSCGLAHWAVADEGNAKIFMTNTPVNTEMIGRVIDVACGRHHTLVLTENGVYAAGDNTFGQLGVGASWAGGIGDSASAAGALLRLPYRWPAPLRVLTAGHYHSAAVDAGGRLYTWGWGIHGQLGLGTIDNESVPQLVTKLQGRKVVSVGCGSCHTVVLSAGGEIWACGAGVLGQLGNGGRMKSSLPTRVAMPTSAAPVTHIAVGYFHNLALTSKGQVWCWGSSPQQVRATHARQAASPTSPSESEPHLLPQLIDTRNVRGRVVRLAAGWHHSCIVDNFGTIYTWGLNFDGQLGSGDRKQVVIPTEIKIRTEHEATAKTSNPKTPEEENPDVESQVLVACGGDFTVFVDDDGKIYATGNTHLQINNEKDKASNRIIMMKTTKRVIKIPASRTNNKFVFQPIDRLDIMFPFELEHKQRNNIGPRMNPLNSMEDFQKTSWADDLILLLKPWINREDLSINLNMAAKFAYHNKMFLECLKLFLANLKCTPQDDRIYVTHTELIDDNFGKERSPLKDEIKIAITNVMSKRIKDVSLTILNDELYPEIDSTTYQSLPCCCNELQYIQKNKVSSNTIIKECDLSRTAANVIDKCISMFPIDTGLWEVCFRHSKDFFIENNLSVSELEKVLRKYMESNATTMAAAIMYSNDCTQYSEILTPKFYLNMCNKVLDTWG